MPRDVNFRQVHEKLVTEASETVIIEVVVSGGSRILRMSLLKDAPFGGDAVIRPSARQRAATVAGVVTDAVTRIAGNVMETAATGKWMLLKNCFLL
ncbi:hypothetical protein Pmar_PMAR017456 [Perkinsus marinus ATCC 50983]|uniref:Uncharacterized protein n=1 Tax=Perkinsus marinus (strain ATCC 50983 / TXsc) TaxID=423536 RepID=C5KG04_PERM5|nr:hypothetical protein Pmar_PMAR017456 [Perkinsus marinus ATCC 50983]EER16568.1 hypothetical protein Pmar_PMAR017456 [Perkinsus marinus ATCC 50983]|eukprot:XP_002784772.1 hypothetical protein Pmar_PMAR017456 [Perkinsus marinus ATCC 50983]